MRNHLADAKRAGARGAGVNLRCMTATDKIDWSGCSLAQCDPLKLGGSPNIDGMRITPETIVDNYESGFNVVEMFPAGTEEQARTILAYAAQRGYLTRPLAA